jgi:hypothetical protein
MLRVPVHQPQEDVCYESRKDFGVMSARDTKLALSDGTAMGLGRLSAVLLICYLTHGTY